EQAISIFAEHGRIPHRVVSRQSDKPTEQQIVVELLHQKPLGANRVERLQQQRAQQPLRRDRWPSVSRVQLTERRRQTSQRLVGQLPDRSQRMIRRYPLLQTHIAEKACRPLIFAPHLSARSTKRSNIDRITLRNHSENAS